MDDLERFWDDMFSEDPARIAAAWRALGAEERLAVAAQLESIVADPDRLQGQRRAAEAALSILHPPLRPGGHSSPPSRRFASEEGGEAGEGGESLLLASGSPRRRELIALLGLPFQTTSADVDETPHLAEDPAAMVIRLSQEKARSAQSIHLRLDASARRQILLAADTTVSLDGEVLGKPRDPDEARTMLTRLRGRSHQVFTAVTLVNPATSQTVTDLASTDVPMRDFSNADMDAYVATGDPFDKAGSYAIQHNGFNPVANLRGCYANVVGLPLCHVTRSLRALGVEPPADVPAACQAHLKYECPVFQAILAGK